MTTTYYTAKALIGGGATALDFFDGDDLNDDDKAFVTVTNLVYEYRLEATSGATENSPFVIAPDTNAGTKRWLLQAYYNTPLRGHMAGLTLSNDTDTDHDIAIAIGEAADSANGFLMKNAAILTKQIDATWAAGDDAGGMEDGDTVGNAEWFHVHLLYNPTTGGVDAGFDTSVTAVNLLADVAVVAAGFTKYRRIGAVKTDGSANILGFSQVGDDFLWDDPPLDINATNPGANAVSATLSIPLGVIVDAKINLETTTSGITPRIYVSSLAANDEAPASGTAPLFSYRGVSTINAGLSMDVASNTSSQVRYRLDSSDANLVVNIATLGWADRRGRDD